MKDLKNSKGERFQLITSENTKHAPEFSGLERRRVPRISLGTEQFKMAASGRLYTVADLSAHGLALWAPDPAEFTEYAVGMTLEGVLKVGGGKFPVRIKIRNRTKQRLGCEWLAPATDLLEAVQRCFDPEILGKSLKPIPSPERNFLWYFGLSGTHLSLRRLNDGQFDLLSLCFHDAYVQWTAQSGVQSGTVVVADFPEETQGIFRVDTLFFKPDSSMDKKKLEIARKVISSSPLPEEVKGWGVRQFSK